MIRTRYGVSPWIDEFPKTRRLEFPRLKGEARYPVAVVGGGLAGVLTAYAFAAAGIRVALLEAARLGHGGAGRGPGVLAGEATWSFRGLEARHGRKAARALFDLSRRAVLDLAATARRLGVKHTDVHDAWRVLGSPMADEKALQKEAAARRDAGLEAAWLKPAAALRDTGVEMGRAATRFHDWGRTNPYQLLMAFAKAASARGALLCEQSEVRRIALKAPHVEVHTAAGLVRADTVIVCTGEPTDLFRPLKRHVALTERYAALTEPLPAALRKRLPTNAHVITDTEMPPHVIRWTAEGRLLVAGADQARPPAASQEKVRVQRTGQLMYELSRLYPTISGVMPEYGWSFPVATTSDGAMYAGPHRNYPQHLFAWATEHDPAQAFLASRILLRHYLGQPDRFDTYFAFTRG